MNVSVLTSSNPQVETFVGETACDGNDLARLLRDSQESERLLAEQVRELEERLQIAEEERIRAVRRARRIENEMAVKTGTGQRGENATLLCERWRELCVPARSHKKVRIEPGSDRHRLAYKQLGSFEFERLLRCVEALSKHTCTVKGSQLPGMRGAHACEGGPSSRQCKHGGTRYADLEHAIGDDKRIENMEALAEKPQEEVAQAAQRVTSGGGIGVLRLLEVVRRLSPDVPDKELQDRLAAALNETLPAEPSAPSKPVRTPEQRQATRAFQQHHFQPDHDHPSDPFEAILGEIERCGKRVWRNWNANEARAQCVAHGGDGPNLKVARGDDGRVLLDCKSRGCKAEDVCAALDWPLRFLFAYDAAGYGNAA